MDERFGVHIYIKHIKNNKEYIKGTRKFTTQKNTRNRKGVHKDTKTKSRTHRQFCNDCSNKINCDKDSVEECLEQAEIYKQHYNIV